MTKRPWTAKWQPPETDEERELRESLVTSKRARQIRLEIERDNATRAVAAAGAPATSCCAMCGRAPDAPCYLPKSRCARAGA
jgi:hypothetical protein